MNKLTIKKGNKKYEFGINNIKYILGNHIEEKYEFMQIIKEVMLNIKDTEYSLKNIGHAEILFNDKPINNKTMNYFFINENYSINNDLKLTSQSIISKYLEIMISKTDNIDTINTINILLESFSDELDTDIIYTRFITYTPKQFLKILNPLFLKNNDQSNEYDLSYNEIIIFQLKMINYISNNQKNNKVLCLIDIPKLTKEIHDYIKAMDQCYVIVSTLIYETNLILEDIYLIDDITLDLQNEEELYNFFINKGINTIQEAKDNMKIIIKNKLDFTSITKK